MACTHWSYAVKRSGSRLKLVVKLTHLSYIAALEMTSEIWQASITIDGVRRRNETKKKEDRKPIHSHLNCFAARNSFKLAQTANSLNKKGQLDYTENTNRIRNSKREVRGSKFLTILKDGWWECALGLKEEKYRI